MKKILSIITASLALAVSASFIAPQYAFADNKESITHSMSASAASKKTIVKYVKSSTLNMRSKAGTKYKVVKVLKKNASVTLTGGKSGSWLKVKGSGKTGWVHSSYLTSKKPSTTRKATAAEQKAWTASLPTVCQKVQIKKFTHTNKNKQDFTFSATANMDIYGKFFYTLKIDGKISANHPASKAIMKHECGHIFSYIYSSKKGDDAYQKLLDKGWKRSDYMRDEKIADCISDKLGGKRETSEYIVGYGTVCSKSQYNVAQKLIDYNVKK